MIAAAGSVDGRSYVQQRRYADVHARVEDLSQHLIRIHGTATTRRRRIAVMLKRTVIAFFLVALMVAAVSVVGCSEAEQGQLPTYNLGDEWTYEASIDGSDYTISIELMGQDVVDDYDCWVFKETYDPAYMGMSTAIVKYYKSNLYEATREASGSIAGVPFTVTVEHSYLPMSPYFPLAVGNELPVEETAKTTTTSQGDTETETETIMHNYRIEKIEEVKVDAGTFKCFKITDGDSIEWYSDKVKQSVKWTDEHGNKAELVSYTV